MQWSYCFLHHIIVFLGPRFTYVFTILSSSFLSHLIRLLSLPCRPLFLSIISLIVVIRPSVHLRSV